VESYPDDAIVQQVVGQIPWGQNIKLLELLKARNKRLWSATEIIANEKGLIAHIRDFLLELGMGMEFVFVGSQYPKIL
jgi:predicted nuclease of restriction endonuclease-like (RecB) superfamily